VRAVLGGTGEQSGGDDKMRSMWTPDLRKGMALIGLLLLFGIGITSAATYSYNEDGYGTFSVSSSTGSGQPCESLQYDISNAYYYCTFYITSPPSQGCIYMVGYRKDTAGTGWYTWYHGYNSGDCGKNVEKAYYDTSSTWKNCKLSPAEHSTWGAVAEYTLSMTVSESPIDIYKIDGTMFCIDHVDLYQKNNTGVYIPINTNSSEYYSFDVLNGSQYKLIFSNGHEYEFTCNGDIEYNYDVCHYIYGYTCNINWVKLWRNDAGSWTYVDMESQPNHGLNTYVLQIESGYNYKVNFSDGHEHEFTCSGSDIRYNWDRCVWAYPPSPWQPPEIIPWYLGYDNNIVFMRDSHGNFIENAQIAVYNKNTGNYTQKWTNTPDPYILLAANNDSNDDVVVMCRTFDGIFTLETVDPAFGTDENVTMTNWTIPIMYNLKIHPTDQSNMPLHHVFVSMYEYAPFDPLAFFGYDTYWGCIPVTNCSGFSRCDLVAEKEGYRGYNITGLNWTTKSALVKDYKHNIVMAKES